MSIIKYIGTITAYIGAKTETAPANDTASSGLNGRLQRIAQRVTSLITEATTIKTDAALIKADVATIKNTLTAVSTITYNNVIVAKTAAETSADIQLTKSAYALTALGLAGGETVILQVKDTVTGAYFNHLTLTAAAPVANITNLPVTVRIDKAITAASVGVVLSYL